MHTDRCKEFYNSQFKNLKQLLNNIKLYSTNSNLKASIIERFNRTTEKSTIGMKPREKKLLERFHKQRDIWVRCQKFKIGDRVRISKYKSTFEKGYSPHWSTEIFTVDHVTLTKPVTYKLKDYQDQPITGGLHEQELLGVKYPDIYLVEKVLKKPGNKVHVKLLGFDSSHNSWINKSDM